MEVRKEQGRSVTWSEKSTTQRGYGTAHQQRRRKWRPIVESGNATCHAKVCLMPSRWIQPGTAWDLGHTEDRSDWTGPEHALCNRSDGGKRSRKARKTAGQRRVWQV